MPYESTADLPEAVKALPAHAQEIWRAAFNAAYEQYGGDEERAFRVAWAAVERQYEQAEDGTWRAKAAQDVAAEAAPGEKAAWTAAYINDLPDSAFLYIEDGGEKDEAGKTTPRSLRHFPYKNAAGEVDLPHLRNALARLGQSDTGAGWLSDDLRQRLISKAEAILERESGGEKARSLAERICSWLKRLAGRLRSPRLDSGAFWLWRDKETARRRWLGLVSNSFYPDRHGEAISRAAWEKAIRRAWEDHPPRPLTSERGLRYRFPDRRVVLDLHHLEVNVNDLVPDYPLAIGTVDGVGMAGPFVLATGVEDDTPIGKAAFDCFERCGTANLGMSHLFEFPAGSRRDPNIYDEIELIRFTVLPAGRAANPLTAFAIVSAASAGGEKMNGIDEELRTMLIGLVGEEKVTDLEAHLSGLAAQAQASGLVPKQAQEPPAEEPTEEPEAVAPEEEPPAPPEPDKIDVLTKALESVIGRLTAIEQALAQVKQVRPEQAEETPSSLDRAKSGALPPVVDGVPLKSPLSR